jgi:hypothetical protein
MCVRASLASMGENVSPGGRRRLGLRRGRGTRPLPGRQALARRRRSWDWRETGTDHQPGILCVDVTELLNHEPELVILSRGRQGRLSASPETLSLLERRGVPVVREKTAAALATYNPLAAERCRVAGHVQPAGSRTLPSRRPLPHHLLAVPDRCRRPRLQQGALFMTSRCACRWLTTTRHKKSSSAWASFGAQFVSGIIMPIDAGWGSRQECVR